MSTPSYSLFPNGSAFMIWNERNCDRCGCSDCDIENAISLAAALDGTLLHCGETPHNKADAIARRLKWNGVSYLQHDCPEFVA